MKNKRCRRCGSEFKRGLGGSTLDYSKTGELRDCCSDACAFREAYGMMPARERRQYRNQYVDGRLVPVII